MPEQPSLTLARQRLSYLRYCSWHDHPAYWSSRRRDAYFLTT